jgi:hypothetical protein
MGDIPYRNIRIFEGHMVKNARQKSLSSDSYKNITVSKKKQEVFQKKINIFYLL